MTDRKPVPADLWREAARRLQAADPEPPLSATRIDALLDLLGPRPPGEDLRDWLKRGGDQPAGRAPVASGGQVIPFDPRRQRFRRVAAITRLAADTGGQDLALPDGELETQDGQFRLRMSAGDGWILLELAALGFTADQFSSKTVALASIEDETVPVALIELDEDGDGTARLPDGPDLRRALLRPVIGLIEDL